MKQDILKIIVAYDKLEWVRGLPYFPLGEDDSALKINEHSRYLCVERITQEYLTYMWGLPRRSGKTTLMKHLEPIVEGLGYSKETYKPVFTRGFSYIVFVKEGKTIILIDECFAGKLPIEQINRRTSPALIIGLGTPVF